MNVKVLVDTDIITAVNKYINDELHYWDYTQFPKLGVLNERLEMEGYHPYEYIMFFTEEFANLGSIRKVNMFTCDKAFAAFLKHKKEMKINIPLLARVQVTEIKSKVKHGLISKECMLLNVHATNLNNIMRLEYALKWEDVQKRDELIALIWSVSIKQLMGTPEYFPYTPTLTEYLKKIGAIHVS